MTSLLVDEFVRKAEVAGFRVHRGHVPEVAGAEVSQAAYALAETGSVVLRASPE